MTERLDLPDRYRRQIEALLAEHVPEAEVWAYGSRVNGRSHPASDLDLVLRGPNLEQIPTGQLAYLEEAFEESSIPILIQTHDWARLPASFHEEIERQFVVVQVAPRGTSKPQFRTTTTLGDVVEIVMGQSPPGSTVSAKGGMPLLNGPTNFGDRHPSPTQFTRDGRKFAKPDDILFCVRGSTTGRMNWADRTYAIGRGIAAIRHRSDPSLQHYVRAVIEHNRPDLLSQATGSTFPNVSAQQLAEIHWPRIDVQEQQTIAHIFSKLEDRLESNRRMSETLEGVARTLFVSWFIDFDPVRAKLDRRDPLLPEHLADLFPDSLVDSTIGLIPSEWRIYSLDDLATFVNGLALQKFPPADGDSLPIIKIAQLRSGSLQGTDLASANLDSKHVVENGDILFSWSGSLECRIWTSGRGALNQHLFKVIPNGLPQWLCYFAIRQHLSEFREVAAGKATTMGHIQRHHLRDAMIAIPSRDVLWQLDIVMSSILDRSITTALEARRLESLREVLLPKLITGQLSVTSYDASHGTDQKAGSARCTSC